MHSSGLGESGPASMHRGAELSESKIASEPKASLAEQLKKLRQAKGHATARGFAKALGISENRYSRYERGEAVPKLDLVWAICNELEITPDKLYGWGPDAGGGIFDSQQDHGHVVVLGRRPGERMDVSENPLAQLVARQ